MFDRRFEKYVKELPTFRSWLREFNSWINQNKRIPITPSKKQVRNLAEIAKDKGLKTVVLERVNDKRTKTGKRVVYRDITTGRFASKKDYYETQGLPLPTKKESTIIGIKKDYVMRSGKKYEVWRDEKGRFARKPNTT